MTARFAANDRLLVEKLRAAIRRLAHDVIQVEMPWSWLVVREALPSRHNARISHNIESNVRQRLFGLGLMSASSEKNLEATRSLEGEFAHAADLVISISDVDAVEIERDGGRSVICIPASSRLALIPKNGCPERFAEEAGAAGCRYAAVMGSAHGLNVEAFFTVFREGLGFLALDEQIWLAGTLAESVGVDERFETFLSVNKSRTRLLGYLTDIEADAIEGYGPIVGPALNGGIYVADTSKAFRRLILDALRYDLPGCGPEVRAQVSLETMTKTWARHVNGLIGDQAPPPRSTEYPTASL